MPGCVQRQSIQMQGNAGRRQPGIFLPPIWPGGKDSKPSGTVEHMGIVGKSENQAENFRLDETDVLTVLPQRRSVMT